MSKDDRPMLSYIKDARKAVCSRVFAATATAILFIFSPRVHAVDAVTVLHTFTDSEGYQPSSLVQAGDGNFYGTTASGGAIPGNSGNGFGTVFEMTPSGTLTVLHSFSGTDGTGPTGVVIGTDGALYGTTQRGGSNNAGTVFKIDLSGTFANLYSFPTNALNEEAQPGRLTRGSDGNFYGITAFGGDNNCGTVFRVTPTGSLTTLYTFPSASGAASGTMALVLATDGNFYGATQSAIFSVTSGGSFTTLHTFTGNEFTPVNAPFLQGPDGKLYGTSGGGGTNHAGNAFSYSPGGALEILYSFSSALGSVSAQPGGLVAGGDGNFYGTIQFGGQASCKCGAVFKIATSSGTLSTAYYFSDRDTAANGPVGTLSRGNDGRLYGSTGGAIYAFDKSQPPPPVISLAVDPKVITTGSSATVTWSSVNATSCTGSGTWTGVISTNGTQAVSPTQIGDNGFTLVCNGDGGSATLSTSLKVQSSASVSLTLSSPTIKLGDTATLAWSGTNLAAYCGATGSWNGTFPSTGTQQVSPNAAGTYTYNLDCASAPLDIDVKSSATLTVTSATATSGKGGGGGLGLEELLVLALFHAFGRRPRGDASCAR